MKSRTPITLITGPLGSGKTTLLRHILAEPRGKIAILMNEFGELAIDSKVIEGQNIAMTELEGGCVCCSLLGEFEAAVTEIIQKVDPELIIVETTGVAEPDALAFDIQESLPQLRLDGVISVMDADMLVSFPQIGHTTRIQIESADMLLLNKIDLVSASDRAKCEHQLREINRQAMLLQTERCRVDPDLLFGLARERKIARPEHKHQPEFDSFIYRSEKTFARECFEQFAGNLPASVYRSKGFIRFAEGMYLFNFVGGRWDLEPFEAEETELVFIGKGIRAEKDAVLRGVERCQQT